MFDPYNEVDDMAFLTTAKVDHAFGVITFKFSDGRVVQYTRSKRDEMFDPHFTNTESGAFAINASVTEDEFNLIAESLRRKTK